MIIKLCKKIHQEYSLFDLNRVIFLYRYITFIFISLFFLFDESLQSVGRKLAVVTCTGIACVLLNHLYKKYSEDTRKILLLLLMETLFNAYILIPSGGLSSPYIWYSLNTILIAAVALDRIIYCWINLFIYLFSSIWVYSVCLGQQTGFLHALEKEANFILSLVLITGIVQMLSGYGKKIREKNLYLQNVNHTITMSNNKIKESMNYVMELYQAVHLFTTQRDVINLNRLLIEYAKKMTGAKTFLIKGNKLYTISEDPYKLTEKVLETKMYEAIREISKTKPCEVYTFKGKRYILSAIGCDYKLYGVVGVDLTDLQMEEKDVIDQLRFLTDLGALVLEKFELERVNRSLLINEEQNRIANEIHDGVLQNLFSISCGINSLMKRTGTNSKKNLLAELSFLRSSVNSTMSDLRSTIYGYSWNKAGANSFIIDIENYMDTIRKFHNVSMQFDLKGKHEQLSTNQKKTIYRLITEAAGNSIKHGKADKVVIQLDIGSSNITLSIIDNGTGFDTAIIEQEGKIGLGIRNIHFLTHSLDGNIQMNSGPGKGTSIVICFPHEQAQAVYEEVVV